MKKYIHILLVINICIALLLFNSCDNKGKDVNDVFFEKHEINDSIALGDCLIEEYDINELRLFFEGSGMNENIGFCSNESTLSFNKVNERFPVKIVRFGEYSVYKVKQGGYFYVFWVKPYSFEEDRSNIEPSVYFSTYLNSSKSLILFDSLIPEKSTAEDVKRIDPFFELSFLNSSGIFSYSYINEEIILQIEYECTGSINGYSDLVVKEKTIISRETAPSKYSAILSSDTPEP